MAAGADALCSSCTCRSQSCSRPRPQVQKVLQRYDKQPTKEAAPATPSSECWAPRRECWAQISECCSKGEEANPKTPPTSYPSAHVSQSMRTQQVGEVVGACVITPT